jgi:hypothetical protein
MRCSPRSHLPVAVSAAAVVISTAALAGCHFASGGAIELVPPDAAAGGGAGTSAAGGRGGGPASGGGAGGVEVTGSAGTSAAGGGGGSLGSSSPDANCGTMSRGAQMVPPDILIVQDRSLSMNNDANDKPCAGGTPMNSNCGAMSKWAQVTAAIGQVVMATDTTVNWGLEFFGTDNACGVTAGAAVDVAPNNSTAIQQAFAATSPSSYTPTRAAISGAATYLGMLTDSNPKYLLLATDGEPNCATTTSPTTDDSAGAEQAVADALTAGFPTFVVGIGNTGGTATLNQMALNGGRPQTGAATSFYEVTDTPSLVSVLQTIVGSVASCTFNLGQPPNAYTSNMAIDVFGDGTKIPKDPSMVDGWSYVSGGTDQIQIYGPTCDAILSGAIQDVTVTYACIIN